MKYLKGRVYKDTVSNGTPKAFYVSIDDGRHSTERNDHMWIPRSKIEVSEPNEVGWCDILVPLWLFTNNRIDYHRVCEITFDGIVIK